MSSRSAPAIAVWLVAASGCASISSVQTADTLGRGNWQVAVESGAQRSASVYLPVYPHFDAAFRYGLAERVDVGARLGYSGLELHGKFLLTRPGDERFAVSLAPLTGGATIPGSGPVVVIAHTALPLLVGFKQRGGHELVLGARVQGRVAIAPANAAIFEGGVSVGYSIRLGERFGLFPELAAMLPIVQTADASALLGTPDPRFRGFGDLFLVQAKLGVSFGRQRARRP